jgi:hypothetical protein
MVYVCNRGSKTHTAKIDCGKMKTNFNKSKLIANASNFNEIKKNENNFFSLSLSLSLLMFHFHMQACMHEKGRDFFFLQFAGGMLQAIRCCCKQKHSNIRERDRETN